MTTRIAAPASTDPFGWRFDNTYARLPAPLFAAATPAIVRDPRVAILNLPLADHLGLDLRAAPSESAAALFAGQALPPGSFPIAQAYAGHQFGHLTMLGDGRAILLGEHCTPAGPRVDVQFKGSGRTRFSRGGDGRAALGPMLREYLISEAMAGLGIPTTRSLAVVTTGEPVYRETLRRGAILTRVAASHIRVGTFQYAAALEDPTILRALADAAIARHDPDLHPVDAPRKYLDFLRNVAHRQAALIARWQLVGFIHGVMNTDNMAVSGETIDYGPCAFMNAYDPATVFSSIDRAGRYAYDNQPKIAHWNLARLAETLLPLLDPDPNHAIALAEDLLNAFPAAYERSWLSGMRRKLGLLTDDPADLDLARSLLTWMQSARADFTSTFRDLASESPPATAPYQSPDFQSWHARYRQRLLRDARPDASLALMRSANPAVIPRNHLVEQALSAAEDHDDLAPLHTLLAALATPYDPPSNLAQDQDPPPDDGTYRTFCGT